MHALVGEMLARGLHVFGGDLQPRALTHGTGVIKILAHGDHHPALGDFQVERRVQSVATMFIEHILAGHTDVSAAELDIGRHVSRADNNHAHVATVGFENQFARSLGVFTRDDARGFQQRHGFVKNAALGERNGDHGWMVSHTGASRRSESHEL